MNQNIITYFMQYKRVMVHVSIFREFTLILYPKQFSSILFLQNIVTKPNAYFFSGSHERRPDDVRHYQIPEAKQHVRRGSGRPVRISSYISQHASPQRIHHRRRVQFTRFGGICHAGSVHRHWGHRVLFRGGMGIFWIFLFCLHIHVDDRIWRFRTQGTTMTVWLRLSNLLRLIFSITWF